jgi:hypothetical protein
MIGLFAFASLIAVADVAPSPAPPQTFAMFDSEPGPQGALILFSDMQRSGDTATADLWVIVNDPSVPIKGAPPNTSYIRGSIEFTCSSRMKQAGAKATLYSISGASIDVALPAQAQVKTPINLTGVNNEDRAFPYLCESKTPTVVFSTLAEAIAYARATPAATKP